MTEADDTIQVLDPQDVFDTLAAVNRPVAATILDPWYNRGAGGVRDDYDQWLRQVVAMTATLSDHIFVWGFPDIVGRVLTDLPAGVSLLAWLTWHFRNCPSVTRGWRPAQQACLHLAREGARVYPEHFMTRQQAHRMEQGRMRFVPGPPTVIEAPLNIGFVGRNEQTGHPAQKPEHTIAPLILMTTREGDTVLDPMCGAGTTGMVCRRLNRRAILSDIEDRWVTIARTRTTQGPGPRHTPAPPTGQPAPGPSRHDPGDAAQDTRPG